jgi:outer membrane protein OmpA-like peptidoglycan-associated protein
MVRRLLTAALVMLAAAALSGCLTPHAKVAPSAAVVAARAGAGTKAAACPAGKLEGVSPTTATFAFDKAELDAVGARRLAGVAAWLACNPGVEVVVLASADNHGDEAHQRDLAAARAHAAAAALRADGAKAAVIRMPAPGAADPLSEPHVLVQAAGRGW